MYIAVLLGLLTSLQYVFVPTVKKSIPLEVHYASLVLKKHELDISFCAPKFNLAVAGACKRVATTALRRKYEGKRFKTGKYCLAPA